MIFLPFAHFFSVILCVFLAIYIYYKDNRSELNRIISTILLAYALWNFGDIIVHNPDKSITQETVILVQNIASIGWVSFAGFMFCFSLVFSKMEKLIQNKWILACILIIPVFFIYLQFTNHLTINPVRQSYGWSFEWSKTIWTYLFYAYYLTYILLSIVIIYLHGRKTKIANEKKHSKILVITFSIGIFAGTLLDVFFQQFKTYNIPPLANLMVVVIASGVLYAIFKYRFLTITPEIAAENIISVMDEFLILFNQEGNILTINKATTDSLQYEQKEIEGKSAAILFPDECFKIPLLERLLKGEVISNNDGCFQAKNKKIVPIIFSSSPLRDNLGVVIGTVFIARDITLQKQIQDELIKARDKAEESDRLKSAFLANMSHEIRTPMNGILGFADLLKTPNLTGEQQQAYIKIIGKSGTRMLNIINDIIDISKIEAGLVGTSKGESNINEQLEYIYTFFKPEADMKGLLLHYKNALPDDEAVIITDREKVFAILTNLIKNAIKFSDQGAIVFGYSIENNHHTSNIQFYVKDTGIGIPKEKQEAIFERFIQADTSDKMARHGAGLGLSITRAYVEMLGGKIWLVSDEGKGSTFYFTLPYNTRPTDKPASEAQMAPQLILSDFKQIVILIAEDDDTSKELISHYIKDFGKKVIVARSGSEAVGICRDNPDIDLILMDIQMPGLNGYEATRQIRQFNKDVVIIAQTALAQTGEREKSIDAGCNEYITKPINKVKLLEMINKHFKN
jgi:PAS domain S-box-containing protein